MNLKVARQWADEMGKFLARFEEIAKTDSRYQTVRCDDNHMTVYDHDGHRLYLLTFKEDV